MAELTLIDQALDFAAGCDGVDPGRDSQVLAARLKPHGLRFLASRHYQRPVGPFDSESLWKAGGFVTMEARPGWLGSAAQNHICLDENPLLQATLSRRTSFHFSEYAPPRLKRWGRYYEALGESGAQAGLGIIAYGAGGDTASLSLGFEAMDFSPSEERALHLAGLVFLDRLTAQRRSALPKLSQRELDCLRFAGAGLTDWDIAERLGLSRATARAHVDNARRKLGAVTRVHAVAKLAAAGLM